jgi:DNA-binding MarR family transcriptional regulator
MSEAMLKLENQLCFRTYTASRLIIRLYKPILDKFNLTYPQYVTMLVLWDKREIGFSELGKILHMKTGTLTPIIQRLEKLDYVEKIKDPSDDRKTIVKLTKKGEELLPVAAKIPEMLAEALGITQEEYLNYVEMLDDFLEKLFYANDIEDELLRD